MCSFTVKDTVHVDGIKGNVVIDSRNDSAIVTFFVDEQPSSHPPLYLIKGEEGPKESSRLTCHIPKDCDVVSVEVFPADITHIHGLQGLRVKISGEGLFQELILT